MDMHQTLAKHVADMKAQGVSDPLLKQHLKKLETELANNNFSQTDGLRITTRSTPEAPGFYEPAESQALDAYGAMIKQQQVVQDSLGRGYKAPTPIISPNTMVTDGSGTLYPPTASYGPFNRAD